MWPNSAKFLTRIYDTPETTTNRKRNKDSNRPDIYWTEIRDETRKIIDLDISESSSTEDILASYADKTGTLQRLTITVGELLNKEGKWRADAIKTQERHRIGKITWRRVLQDIKKEYQDKMNQTCIRIISFRPRQKVFEKTNHVSVTVAKPILELKNKPIELSKYTVKTGREIVRRSETEHTSHPSWKLDRETMEKMTLTWIPKNYPNHYISFWWRLRHLCLFHPHHTMKCTHCNGDWRSLEHIFLDCAYAKETWTYIEQRTGKPTSRQARLWGSLDTKSQLWKHRLVIAATVKALWDQYWKKAIDNKEKTPEELAQFAHMESVFHSPYYR
jgi:hypothetical protein